MQWNVVNHLKSCISHGWATPVQSAMLKVHLCMSSCYLVIFSLHINNGVKQHYAILEALLFFCNFKWQKIVESSFKNSVWDLQNLYLFIFLNVCVGFVFLYALQIESKMLYCGWGCISVHPPIHSAWWHGLLTNSECGLYNQIPLPHSGFWAHSYTFRAVHM